MKDLQPWFEKGMNEYSYVHSMEKHKENLLTVYQEVKLSDEEKSLLHALQQHQLKAVILTADWCGDAMVNVPIFLRLAHEAWIETRFLIRDDNLELMDQYLTNGKSRSIPIIILLNKDGQEIGKWGPRAPEVQQMVNGLQENLPAKEDPAYEEAFKGFIKEMTNRFRSDETLWEHVKKSLIAEIRSSTNSSF